MRVGDAVAPHGGSCSKHRPPHGAKVQNGPASVFVNGKAMAREGDTVMCATGETAPLLRGRATVVAGDDSPVAEGSVLLGGDVQDKPLGGQDGDMLAAAPLRSSLELAIDKFNRIRKSQFASLYSPMKSCGHPSSRACGGAAIH